MPSIAKDPEQSVIRITEHLEQVQRRTQLAAQTAGRDPRSIQILAVSKRQPLAAIRAAFAAGQRAFGENYLQEASEKILALADIPIEWHFIGRIQRNKTRAIAEQFSWVHTLDREQIARRLAGQRPLSLQPLNVCIQVKLVDEAAKSGVLPDELGKLAALVVSQPRLRLRGLMCIPPATQYPEEARRYFRRLREMLDMLRQDGFELDTLSMGMSADLEIAISEGATMVRIGTAIFGPRRKDP
jgi:pyridoxal phosphate enzyme (YggS family)